MKRACPACSAKTILPSSIIRSATGVGPNPRCHACGARWSVKGNWQGNYIGFILLAFILCGAISVQEKSYAPYLIFPLITAAATYVVLRYARPVVIEPMAPWLLKAHYATLAIGIAFVVYAIAVYV